MALVMHVQKIDSMMELTRNEDGADGMRFSLDSEFLFGIGVTVYS